MAQHFLFFVKKSFSPFFICYFLGAGPCDYRNSACLQPNKGTKWENRKPFLQEKKKQQLHKLNLMLNSLKDVYFCRLFCNVIVLYIRNKGVISSYLITSWEQENALHSFTLLSFQGSGCDIPLSIPVP